MVLTELIDCGKSFMTDDEARGVLKQSFPDAKEIDQMEFGTFKDSTCVTGDLEKKAFFY